VRPDWPIWQLFDSNKLGHELKSFKITTFSTSPKNTIELLE